jgi:hypothetical protein
LVCDTFEKKKPWLKRNKSEQQKRKQRKYILATKMNEDRKRVEKKEIKEKTNK